MPEVLYHAQNEALEVTIYSDASATYLERESGFCWQAGPVALQEDNGIDVGHCWLRNERSICEEFPGRFRGTLDPDGALRFTLLGRAGREVGQFRVVPRLDGEWFELRLTDIDESIPSLFFPPPLESDSLILPQGVGRWIRQPVGSRYIYQYPGHLNMRWIGGQRGGHVWMAIYDEGYADALVHVTRLYATPGWLKSLGTWPAGSVRTLRYHFQRGSYQDLAAVYREYAISKGLHRSLRDKIAENPASGNLLGGRMLSLWQAETETRERYEDRLEPVPDHVHGKTLSVVTSYADARAIIEDARRISTGRGIVALRGWINGGYDETHPDIWPPEPKVGTLDELRNLLTLRDPLVTVLHDNYQDMYVQSASWPRGLVIGPNGEPMAGGIWSGGQAYIINGRDGLAYAQRNWEQIRTLAPRGIFIDTTTAVIMYQSFEPGNTLTRAEDMACKSRLLAFYREQSQIVGSEEGADFGVPLLDWIENRHRRVPGESIPLWPLVFHDAVLNMSYVNAPVTFGADTDPRRAPDSLVNMLWAYPMIFHVRGLARWQEMRQTYQDTRFVDEWIGRVGADAMIDHAYLTDDFAVEMTEFSSGAAIMVNFAEEPRQADGVTIPARGFVLRD